MSVVLALLSFALQEPKEPPAGPQTIHVTVAPLREKPKHLSKKVGDLKYGTVVAVAAVENEFGKVTVPGVGSGWIHLSAMVAKEKFKPEAADERQASELRAQGHETTKGAGESGKKFTKEVEDQRRKDGSDALKKGYDQVDVMEKTTDFNTNRDEKEKALLEFQKTGKLGEHSPVK